MSINSDAPELITTQGVADTKIASATDRQAGQLRHEANQQATNEAQVVWEHNLREEANMEIGRARNITRVV